MPAKITPPPQSKGEPIYALVGLTFRQVVTLLERMSEIEGARLRASLIRAGYIRPAKEHATE